MLPFFGGVGFRLVFIAVARRETARDAQAAAGTGPVVVFLSFVFTLDYYEKDNTIISDYPVLRPTGSYTFKQGQLYQLLGTPIS